MIIPENLDLILNTKQEGEPKIYFRNWLVFTGFQRLRNSMIYHLSVN